MAQLTYTENLAHAHQRIQKEKLLDRLLNSATNPDSALWGDPAACDFVGWMNPPTEAEVNAWQKTADEFMGEHTQTLMLIGIGGSSLGAKLLAYAMPKGKARLPNLTIIDTLDHVFIDRILKSATPQHTKIIVASKSGTTLEIIRLYRRFALWMREGWEDQRENIGDHFVAITDPGSELETLAREQSFFAIIHGHANIGGRFSAFSPFGLFPAACSGVDILQVAKSTRSAHQSYQNASQEVEAAPMLTGVLWASEWWAKHECGQSLLAFSIQDPRSAQYPLSPERLLIAWLEQLLAESTGKKTYGLLPFFQSDPKADLTSSLFKRCQIHTINAEQKKALTLSTDDLPATMVHSFYAVSLYAALYQMNPFDQPDVESTKILLREKLRLITHPTLPPKATLTWEQLKSLILPYTTPTFIAILDYQTLRTRDSQDWESWLPELQQHAACPVSRVEGPAFLHSVGQLYKGAEMALGGLFVVLLDPIDPQDDMNIPDENYGFSTLRIWQAMADIDVMRQRKRKVVVFPSNGHF